MQPFVAATSVNACGALDAFFAFYREVDFPEARNSISLEWGVGKPNKLASFADARRGGARMEVGPKEIDWIHVTRVLEVGREDNNPTLNLVLHFGEPIDPEASGWLEMNGREKFESLLKKFYGNPHIQQLLQTTPSSIAAYVSDAG